MTSREWLNTIMKAQDTHPAMEKLIIKYGEMLLEENQTVVDGSDLNVTVNSLPPSDPEIKDIITISSANEFTADQWKEAYMLGSENTEINNNKRTVLSAEHALREYRRKRDGYVGI